MDTHNDDKFKGATKLLGTFGLAMSLSFFFFFFVFEILELFWGEMASHFSEILPKLADLFHEFFQNLRLGENP